MIGCSPSIKYIQKPSIKHEFGANDVIEIINISSVDDVKIKELKKQELFQHVYTKLHEKQKSTINMGGHQTYKLDINITRYAANENFSWEIVLWVFTLLQPIYIDAHVIVTTLTDNETYAEFDIEKYHLCAVTVFMSSCINSVKRDFSAGIADAVFVKKCKYSSCKRLEKK